MEYKYQLDKSSKKFNCPQCHKKTFVRYIDAETNGYLPASIGRCDRESKCAYHCPPNGNKPITSNSYIQQPALEPTCHVDDVIPYYGRHHQNNNFITYLQQFFSVVDISKAIKKYFIGTSNHWEGATVFLQVDEQMNICAGKVMQYEANTGKRVKKPYSRITWLHKVLHVKHFVLQQCLFGLHNICDYEKGSTVCIVESEKTAIIMSIVNPAYLWLATGSKTNLKEELLKPLKGYNIIVYPDKTEFVDWNKKVTSLKQNGYKISCSNFLENKNLEEGADLADLLLNH